MREFMQEPTCSVSNRSEFTEDAVCAVSYITIVPALVVLFLTPFRKRPGVRFHACQAILVNGFLLGLVVCLGMAASFALILGTAKAVFVSAILLWAARLLCMACWAVPALRLANGRGFRLPILGTAAAHEAASSFYGMSSPVSASETKPIEKLPAQGKMAELMR